VGTHCCDQVALRRLTPDHVDDISEILRDHPRLGDVIPLLDHAAEELHRLHTGQDQTRRRRAELAAQGKAAAKIERAARRLLDAVDEHSVAIHDAIIGGHLPRSYVSQRLTLGTLSSAPSAGRSIPEIRSAVALLSD
jgi:hypothetical protein